MADWRFRTQSQLSIGRKYRFQLGGFTEAVTLSGFGPGGAECPGTERQESGDIIPVYDAGIAFDEVLTEKAEELLAFMEKNIVLARARSAGFRVGSRSSPSIR